METRRQNERILFNRVEDLTREVAQLKQTVGVLSHWATEWSTSRKGRRAHPYARKAVATMVAHGRRTRVVEEEEEKEEQGEEWDTSGWYPPRDL